MDQFLTGKSLIRACNSRLEKEGKNPIRAKSVKNSRNLLLKFVVSRYQEDSYSRDLPANLCKRALNYWASSDLCIFECINNAIKDYTEISGENHKNTEFHTKITCRDEHKIVICNLPASKFYDTREWKRLRYSVLRERGAVCECCGLTPKNKISIHVDHIKPRSVYPELALNKNNLQILCEACNIGKSNVFEDDWRI